MEYVMKTAWVTSNGSFKMGGAVVGNTFSRADRVLFCLVMGFFGWSTHT